MNHAVVIDNGTGYMKVGRAGEQTPTDIFRTVVGLPRLPKTMKTLQDQEYFIGPSAQPGREYLSFNFPIQRGIIENYDLMERVWHHSFYETLSVSPNENPVFLTEPQMNPKFNREKIAQIMFESFNVPSLYIGKQAPLSLYTASRTTGLVVESGHGVTCISPIQDGYSINSAVSRLNFGGSDLTDYLRALLTEVGFYAEDYADREIVREIKETCCRVGSEEDPIARYRLPDGEFIVLKSQVTRCPELIFAPGDWGSDQLGLSELIYSSVSGCAANLRRELYRNILLTGGNNLFPGITDRVISEVSKKVPNSVRVEVVDITDKQASAWMGGSILCSLEGFQSMWVSRDEYEESGETILHQKFAI